MATGTLNGTDLVLKLEKTFVGLVDVGYATNFTLDVESDAVDRTSKDSNGWKDIFLGVKSWTISCDALYQNESNPFNNFFIDVFGILDNRIKVTVEFNIKNGNASDDNVKYIGSAHVVSLNLKGDTEAGAEYQIFLAGKEIIRQIYY